MADRFFDSTTSPRGVFVSFTVTEETLDGVLAVEGAVFARWPDNGKDATKAALEAIASDLRTQFAQVAPRATSKADLSKSRHVVAHFTMPAKDATDELLQNLWTQIVDIVRG